MSVMNHKTLLEFYVDVINVYLDEKPKHDFGFCWWAYIARRREYKHLCDMWGFLGCTVYTDMAEILRVYCEHHGLAPMEYLSTRHGYNYERAHRLTLIRDVILLPRIKELS